MSNVSLRTRSRNWFCTVNNPVEQDERDLLDCGFSYLCFQYEKGASGTVHIQGVIVFLESKSLSQMSKFVKRANWSVCRDLKASIAYCSKAEGRVDGPYEHGVKPQQGKRTDLSCIVEEAKTSVPVCEIVDKYPVALRYQSYIHQYRMSRLSVRSTMPVVYIFWGPSESGKTRTAYEWFGRVNCFKPAQPREGAEVWFDKYKQETCILLDDWDFSRRGCYNWLLNLCDRYPMNVQCKGIFGGVEVNSPYIVLTSNDDPRHWWSGGLGAMTRRISFVYHFEGVNNYIPKAPALKADGFWDDDEVIDLTQHVSFVPSV